jgi:hypothetical protein
MAFQSSFSESPPILPPEVEQVFVVPEEAAPGARYEPALLGFGRVFFEDARRGVAAALDCARLARCGAGGAVDWLGAERWAGGEGDLDERPPAGARFAPVPARAQRPASYEKWARELAAALARTETLVLLASPASGELSRPGESERDFRIRLAERARERRDAELLRVRERFAPQLAALDERIRRTEARLAAEAQQAEAQRWGTVLAGAASVAGVLFGRRKLSATNLGRVGTAVRSAGRMTKEAGDVERAAESLAALRARRAALDADLAAALEAAAARVDPLTERFETVVLRPQRSDVEVRRVVLAWVVERGQRSIQ